MILDMNGAEKLVGHGDMLFAPANASKPTRLQGAWVTEREIHEVCAFIRGQREVVYETQRRGSRPAPRAGAASAGTGSGDDEDLLAQAAELVDPISARFDLDAAAQAQGRVRARRPADGPAGGAGRRGPGQGSKARDVLITWEEWEERRSA